MNQLYIFNIAILWRFYYD